MKKLLSLFALVQSLAFAQQSQISIKVPDKLPSFASIAWLDDDHIAGGCENTNAIIWDIRYGVDVDYYSGNESKVDRVLFTPDHKLMITSCTAEKKTGSIISVYNVSDKKKVCSFPVVDKAMGIPGGLETYNKTMAITPDSKTFVFLDYLNIYHFFDLLTGKEFKSMAVGIVDRNVVFTPDSKYVVCVKENMMYDLHHQGADTKYQAMFYSISEASSANAITPVHQIFASAAKPFKTINVGNSDVVDFGISPDGKYLAVTFGKGRISLWDLNQPSQQPIMLTTTAINLSSLFFTPGSEKLLAISKKEKNIYSLNLNNIQAGFNQTPIIQNEKEGVSDCNFSPNGKFFVTKYGKSRDVIFYNTATGKEFKRLKIRAHEMFESFFCLDNKSIITARNMGEYENREEMQQKMDNMLKNIKIPGGGGGIKITLKDHSQDSSKKSFQARPADIRQWNFIKGEVSLKLQNKADTANRKVKTNGKYNLVITNTKEKPSQLVLNVMGLTEKEYLDMMPVGSSVVYFINEVKKDTFYIYTIDSTDWMIVNKKGYFWASKNAAAVVHYKVNDKIYSFNQFDLQFNRPDKILSEIGYASATTIKTYRDAVLGRWLELKVDTAQFDKEINFNAPQLDVIFPQGFNYTANSTSFKFKIKAKDDYNNLKAALVWVNGSPVYGLTGLNLSSMNTKDIEKTLDVKLTPGKNIIEVAVLNSRFVQSYKEQFEIDCNISAASKPALYLITMGVSQYNEPSWYDLKYAAKDADDINKVFSELNNDPAKPFSNFIPFNMTDEKVSAEELKNAHRQLMESKPGDKVIVFYSGHGVRNKKGDLLLGTTTIGTSANDYANGLPMETINNLIADIPARQKLVLIDACQSGRVNEMADEKPGETITDNKGSKSTQGFIPPTQSAIAAEKMFSGFVNLAGTNGATVIGATGGDKSAYEEQIVLNGTSTSIQNGVFTYCIKEGLTTLAADYNKDMHVDIIELKKYLTEKTRSLSDPKHPQEAMCTQENLLNNWIIR